MSQMDVNVQLSDALRQLVDEGVLTFSCSFTRDGLNYWFQCVQPHPKLGVFTNQFMTSEVALRHFGASSKFRGGKKAVSPAGEPKTSVLVSSSGSITTYSQALLRATQKNLSEVVRAGITNSLPADSLTWWDIGREDVGDFHARAFLVSAKIGSVKLASRVSTDRNLTVPGAYDLKSWWDGSTPQQRWDLLTTIKKRGKTPATCTEGLKPSFEGRLKTLPCPFRNPETALAGSQGTEQEVREDAGTPSEDEYDFTGGVSIQ